MILLQRKSRTRINAGNADVSSALHGRALVVRPRRTIFSRFALSADGPSALPAFLRIKPITIAMSILLVAGAGISMGQSGKRLPQTRPTPTKSDPTPSPTPQPLKQVKAQFALKIVRDIPANLYMAFPFPERMEEWVVSRLKKSTLLDVTAGDQANHAEAIRLAKTETEALTVWLQLEEDPFAKPDAAGRHEVAGRVRINFSIFAPVTGKTKYSGVVVLNQSTRGVAVLSGESTCNPTVRGEDRMLLRASFETAARIMDYLKVPVTPSC